MHADGWQTSRWACQAQCAGVLSRGDKGDGSKPHIATGVAGVRVHPGVEHVVLVFAWVGWVWAACSATTRTEDPLIGHVDANNI